MLSQFASDLKERLELLANLMCGLCLVLLVSEFRLALLRLLCGFSSNWGLNDGFWLGCRLVAKQTLQPSPKTSDLLVDRPSVPDAFLNSRFERTDLLLALVEHLAAFAHRGNSCLRSHE